MGKGLYTWALISFGLAASVATPAQANTYVLLDRQGGTPDRVAVYAETFVRDWSPVNLTIPVINKANNSYQSQPTIKGINIGLVYEAEGQPYWTEMQVHFRCPGKTVYVDSPQKKGKKAAPRAPQVLAMPASVTFRLESGMTRRKDSFEITQLSQSDWQTTSGLTMRRAYLLACNDDAVQNIAERTSFDEAGNFVPAMFDAQMAALGLDNTLLFPGSLFMHDVAEMTWAKLWADVKTPPINNGRDLTDEEIAAFDKELKAKVAEMQARLDRDKAKVMASLQQQDAEFRFQDEIARVRGNRRTSKTEAAMIMAWQGKSERDVAIAMGAPNVSEAGGVRFLSYGQDYDSRYVVQRVVSGATWTEGVYKSCNIQFVLIPDAQSQYRVADVVISAFRSGDGWAPDLCSEMTEAPR
jgi:hypothetical protein